MPATPPQDFISRPPYQVVQPGAYSSVDASLLANPNPGLPAPIVAVLGVAFGGKPDTPLYFRSTGQLRQVLQSGPAYDVARFAFDGGAQQVCVIRVGNAITQGMIALAGASGTVVTLTSQDWGSWVNAILVTVATGPIITITYTNVLGQQFLEQWNLTGVGSLTPALIANAINGQVFGYPQSNYVTAAAGAGTLPLTNISAQPLTGGTDGTSPAAGDWTVGLQALETEPVDILVPAVGDATVHAQVQTHCINLSSPAARHERTAIYGAVLGETVAQQITRIGNLNSARSQLVYPGILDFNAQGAQTTYDPFYAAGKVAGMHVALPDVATPLIHARLPVVGVEAALSTIQGGAIDQLLNAGVTPIAPAPRGGYWLVDSLTGYTPTDGTFHDFHKTRSADFCAQYARNQLEAEFVGAKNLGDSTSIAQAGLAVMDDLLNMQVIQQHGAAAIVTQGPTPTSWNVGLPVMLIDADKFIFISVQLQPSAVTSNTGSLTASDTLT